MNDRFGDYFPHRGPIMAYELTCPICGEHIETRNAEDIEVLDEGVIGVMEWECDECGATGDVSFFAEFSDFRVRDGYDTRYYQLSREDGPATSKARKPTVKRTAAARKTTAGKPTAKKAPVKKPTTRKAPAKRKTTGARR